MEKSEFYIDLDYWVHHWLRNGCNIFSQHINAASVKVTSRTVNLGAVIFYAYILWSLFVTSFRCIYHDSLLTKVEKYDWYTDLMLNILELLGHALWSPALSTAQDLASVNINIWCSLVNNPLSTVVEFFQGKPSTVWVGSWWSFDSALLKPLFSTDEVTF